MTQHPAVLRISTKRSHDSAPSGPTNQHQAVPRLSTKRSHDSAPSDTTIQHQAVPRFGTKRSHDSAKSGPTIQHQAVPLLSTLGKETGTPCTGGWVGPRAGLDVCGKSPPPPPQGFDSQTSSPVASRYTPIRTEITRSPPDVSQTRNINLISIDRTRTPNVRTGRRTRPNV
jgi:hypothetical protein